MRTIIRSSQFPLYLRPETSPRDGTHIGYGAASMHMHGCCMYSSCTDGAQ
jgi:hypothetical protein